MGAEAPPPLPRRPRGRPALFAVATSAAVLALAGESPARGADQDVGATLRVCGARACTAVKTTLPRLRPVFDGRSSSPLPPPAAAFYVLELSVEGAPRVQTGWYVPSTQTTRWLAPRPSEWTKLRRRGARFLRHRLPAGPPHAAPRPARVVVGGRRVQDPAAYAHVFDRFPRAPGPPPKAHWVWFRIRWPVGTPWRFEHAELSASPSHRILARRGGWYRIPIAFARVIARDASP